MSVAWIDGRLVMNVSGRELPAVGWGAFSTVGCDAGVPLLWPFHCERLSASLRRLGAGEAIRLPDEVELSRLLDACGLEGPARLRVCGVAGIDSVWRVHATATECPEAGPTQAPVRLVRLRWHGVPPLVGHKMLNRERWDAARKTALERGADDALLVDAEGAVLETSVANIWVRCGDSLLTPPAPHRCLPGVMRRWILDNAGRFGVSAGERDLRIGDVAAADEVLISNAVIGVRRVSRVVDRRWSRWPLFDQIAGAGVPAPGWPIQDTR